MLRNRHQDIEISEDKPFANDKLEREEHAVNFERIVSLYGETGCVMALNGLWGTGKTTFVKMLMQDMKNKGFKPLYFNAWTNDFVSDPLVALLSEIKGLNADERKYTNLLACGAKIVVDVTAGIANHMMKAVTGVDARPTAMGLANTFKAQIDNYAGQKKAFEDFKKALQEYVVDNTGEDKPVVFFIDELDRCNPRFAVQVLERVKHLFDIPNIVFVLIINKEQLYHAICGYYGSVNIDAENYLRRFVDIEYQLPEADKEKYYALLYQEYELDDIFESTFRNKDNLRQDKDYFKTLMCYLIRYSDLDLRSIDKFVAYTRLMLQTFGIQERYHSGILVLLSYIRIADNQLFEQIRTHQLKPLELIEKLDVSLAGIIQKINNANAYPYGDIMSALAQIAYAYDPELVNGEFQGMLMHSDLHNIHIKDFNDSIVRASKDYQMSKETMNVVFEHIGLMRTVKI